MAVKIRNRNCMLAQDSLYSVRICWILSLALVLHGVPFHNENAAAAGGNLYWKPAAWTWGIFEPSWFLGVFFLLVASSSFGSDGVAFDLECRVQGESLGFLWMDLGVGGIKVVSSIRNLFAIWRAACPPCDCLPAPYLPGLSLFIFVLSFSLAG